MIAYIKADGPEYVDGRQQWGVASFDYEGDLRDCWEYASREDAQAAGASKAQMHCVEFVDETEDRLDAIYR